MDKFGILHLKPCFKTISDEIERLRLKFGHLLAREFSVSLVYKDVKLTEWSGVFTDIG